MSCDLSIWQNNCLKDIKSQPILGVVISDDINWNNLRDYVVSKAIKKPNTLRLLERAGQVCNSLRPMSICRDPQLDVS